MWEPLFTRSNEAAWDVHAGDPRAIRLAAALHRATALAFESALRFGIDMPVGAVALRGNMIVGRGFAGDKRLGHPLLHAEAMAVLDAEMAVGGLHPDTVVVTIEPCDNCQDYLAGQDGLEHVAFGLSRADVVSKGLLKPHAEMIADRLARLHPSLGASQIDDDQLRTMNFMLLDRVTRDTSTGEVVIDRGGILQDAQRWDEASE